MIDRAFPLDSFHLKYQTFKFVPFALSLSNCTQSRCPPHLPVSVCTEANSYYAGQPSNPVLVARTTSNIWKPPTGRWGYLARRELKVVGDHALKEVWEDDLAFKTHGLLDSMAVMWTSTDVVRISVVENDRGDETPDAIVVWIGVIPCSLSNDEGLVVAHKCKELLIEYGITDVDVEIRESVVTRSAKLLKPSSNYDGTVDVRNPLTATLGLPICAQSTPWAEGTGGFFMSEGGDSKRLFLVTARHVVFDNNDNDRYKYTDDSQRRRNVILLGDAAYNKFVDSIKKKTRSEVYTVENTERYISENSDSEEDRYANRRKRQLEDAKRKLEDLNTFSKDVSIHWATAESRILGHVIFSPPIDVIDQYTEDFAIIEVDASKVDTSNFKGNVIDLGTDMGVGESTMMMDPTFKYPFDRLLRLNGTISDEEMRHPTMVDRSGNQVLIVMKHGNNTDLTIGHANDFCSYVRWDVNEPQTSKQWAIFPFDKSGNSQKGHSGPFSGKGDSGSVVVDARGRVGGLITGGAGSSESLDITYATPISFLLKRIHAHGFPNASLVDPGTADRRSFCFILLISPLADNFLQSSNIGSWDEWSNLQ